MSREDAQFKLRLPAELKAKVEKSATENRRSLNAELVARLEESFARDTEVEPHALTFSISKEKLAQGDMRENELILGEATISAFREVEVRMQKRMEAHLEALKQATEELNKRMGDPEKGSA
ncbi:MAG: Arc family DNA-binding protein [Pseudomonas oryzihabitans]|uniref:Arc family DNA-binding protein n=1 Tax=Pseudomonas oryzihabitans TaxID=47885 RepID=UPI0029126909|nr:Arc family DNA-binding protein [Pseudomonas oryzihabitans]MDU4059453.1 Arc family DNA-binding protein [Pseudomonas oryzihabitans]